MPSPSENSTTPPLRHSTTPLLLTAAVLLLAGCPKREEKPPAPPPPARAITASPDGWTLTNDRLSAENRLPYLGNGYVGLQTGPTGCGWDPKGPLPAYVAGLYVNEVLAAIPSPGNVVIRSGESVLGTRPAELSGYHQELALREGRLKTSMAWRAGNADAEVTVTCAPHRARPHLTVTRVAVKNRGTAEILVEAPSPQFGAPWTAESPVGSAFGATAPGGVRIGMARALYGTDTVGNLEGGTAGNASLPVPPGQTREFVCCWSAFTSLDGPSPAEAAWAELRKAEGGATGGMPELDQEHLAAWKPLWDGGIEIAGDPEAQAVVRVCRFWLLQSVRPEAERGVPPMGLSSAAFNGHVFWDMDSWMLPALLPQNPDLARAMLAYRLATLPGARENARKEGMKGAAYAWESAATGRESVGIETQHGRHVNGDVALACRQYWLATGDRAWLRQTGWPILQATADYWTSRAEKGADGAFHIRKVTTPDENAGVIDDSAWTLHVARVNLEFAAEAARLTGASPNPQWLAVARGLKLLRDASGLIQEFAGYKGLKTKQADTLLLLHPGGLELADPEVARLYDYYAPRVIATGPAMTNAIHAVVAARLGRGDEALKQFRASYEPFLRPPFGMFSEKRTRDNLCFLTGCAGVLEAVLYGFAGFQFGDTPGAVTRAALPPAWQSITLRGVQWRGKTETVQLGSGAAPGAPERLKTPR